MAFSRGARAAGLGLAAAAAGAIGATALGQGLWGLSIGAALTTGWLLAMSWWNAARDPLRPEPRPGQAAEDRESRLIALRMLLDVAPTPLVAIEDRTARALNRAARRLFDTDDLIASPPATLLDPDASHVHLEGRQWRIDRVTALEAARRTTVAALIDIHREERAAEARATADLIQILGHEILNGLAPIVSLAESGLAAVAAEPHDPALLKEILGTLARRTEGLQRFTEGYRALARLPEPVRRPVPVGELLDDLARLFAGRWAAVRVTVTAPGELRWPLDRDQIHQAIWALLQNAAEVERPAGVAAEVSIDAHETDGHLLIAVADNGTGIAPESSGRIFRPFHTTKPGGTGIGLGLARQIVHAHGGLLTLQPIPRTTFLLQLPR